MNVDDSELTVQTVLAVHGMLSHLYLWGDKLIEAVVSVWVCLLAGTLLTFAYLTLRSCK